MIEHQSVKNLIVGAIVIGIVKMFDGYFGGKVEVFNPYNQRVCEMPDLIGDTRILFFSIPEP